MKKQMLSAYLAFLLIFSSGCGSHPNGSASRTPSSTSSDTSLPTSRSGGTAAVADYFPVRENVRYVYQGSGNEYASYDVYIDYTDSAHIQQRINNGGTETVRVIEVDKEKAACVFRQGEVYYRENFLGKAADAPEVLLKAPVETGTSWRLGNGGIRTITGVSAHVDTPSGSYSAVSVETRSDSGTTIEYYAKNIGLVKSVAAGNGYEVSSSLSGIQENVSFVQTVRFFYPNMNDGKLYYKDQKISFRTNDRTRKVLEAAYKEPAAGQTGSVFPGKTSVNSYYLNRDGMVYLDLNQAFLTGMNAGSGYESMILQSVANTFGSYYGAEKVVLTIDGSPYESGHIKMKKGEYLRVQTNGCLAAP